MPNTTMSTTHNPTNLRDRYRLWLENSATDEQVFVIYMMGIVGMASVFIGLLALVGWL